MKFGKRIRVLAYEEWKDKYVDYKQLKKYIKQYEYQINIKKSEKLKEFIVHFQQQLQQTMEILNQIYNQVHQRIEKQQIPSLQKQLGNVWVLKPAKARSLLLATLELSHYVDCFRRYIVMNTLALIKITKKFDKKLKIITEECKMQHFLSQVLIQQPFYNNSQALDRICQETIALTDRLMLCIVPDGDFKIQTKSIVCCPICLDGDHISQSNSITLSCQHTFCWSCLSRAKEHFHCCPLCRKEQSIDPRDYAVDGLLRRFQRVYAYVESQIEYPPIAISSMKPILIEGFEVIHRLVHEIEILYAQVHAPQSSNDTLSNDGSTTLAKRMIESMENTLKKQITFKKGDLVEVLCDDIWCPGIVLKCNEDESSYAVLWWFDATSQRYGKQVAGHRLREPLLEEEEENRGSILYELAVGAIQIATDWAIEPFKQKFRSLSL